MKFIADDGKIFDTMEECEYYEKIHSEGKEIAILWDDYVTIYDEQGHEMTSKINWKDNLHDYLDNTVALITDESCFIKIDVENWEWEKIYNYFYHEYGIDLPKFHGLWRYDWSASEWIEFTRDYENFKKMWAPMGIF